MAWTQTQLDDLEAAYAQGLLSVSIAGKSITYRSRAEMKAVLDEMRAALGVASAMSASQQSKRVTLLRMSRAK
jgi:hypothetical protein